MDLETQDTIQNPLGILPEDCQFFKAPAEFIAINQPVWCDWPLYGDPLPATKMLTGLALQWLADNDVKYQVHRFAHIVIETHNIGHVYEGIMFENVDDCIQFKLATSLG